MQTYAASTYAGDTQRRRYHPWHQDPATCGASLARDTSRMGHRVAESQRPAAPWGMSLEGVSHWSSSHRRYRLSNPTPSLIPLLLIRSDFFVGDGDRSAPARRRIPRISTGVCVCGSE